jgi:glycosyltransferase involved in cell wall biosynthesis
VRVVIATAQVPFVRGGAEGLAAGLRDALQAAGHTADIVALPFKWYPPECILDQMLAWRLLDVTESFGTPIDLLIGLRFPAYLVPHPNKVLWLLHQHKTAYEWWDHPFGDLRPHPRGLEVRNAIRRADRALIPEAKSVFTISANVRRRLSVHCGIDSTVLYPPPPQAARFFCAASEPYLFFPSRLLRPKRQGLVLEALARTRHAVRLRFAGSADEPAHAEALQRQASDLRVHQRVEWLGPISDQDKLHHYAHALGVVFPPLDEDFGYVALEAMLAAKPVITCTDSGGTLELVEHRVTGLIVEPTAAQLASAMDSLWENHATAAAWGQAGCGRVDRLNISWDNVVRSVTQCA